jgi:inorganic pyrophosphatase
VWCYFVYHANYGFIPRTLGDDDPGYRSYEDYEELPEHRLTELQRFFQDYKVLEGKEVDVGDFSSPEAVGAVRHAMDLYEKHFAATR